MKMNDDDMDALMGKDFSGELTPEEKALLEDWQNQSDENRVYYQHLKTLFQTAEHLKTHQVFDTDAAWQALKGKIKERNKQSRVISLVVRLAASLVLVMVATVFLYQKKIQPQDVVTVSSTNETSDYTLPDGSGVFLNKNSTVNYAYHPLKRIRKAQLSGEAYFEMSNNEHGEFLLEAGGLWIKDIGTAFNVKAYPGEDTVEVFVESGEVIFYTQHDSINIRAGETGYYSRQLKAFSKQGNQNQNVLSYKTQILVFENTLLSEVIETINEVYDVKLKLDRKELESCRITVTFKHETIDVIVEIIAETLSLTWEKNNHEIIFKGNGCSL